MFLTPYIVLFNRHPDDRLGANIISYMIQIIIANHYNFYIETKKFKFYNENSIFIKTIKSYIEFHNSNKIKMKDRIVSLPESTFELHLYALKLINVDIITHFREKLQPKFIEFFDKYKYDLPYDSKKTLLVHLRLDDLNEDSYYNGNANNMFLSEIVNNLKPTDVINEYLLKENYEKFLELNSEIICLNSIGNHNFFYGQSSISEQIIEDTIINFKEKTDIDNVILIASPKGEINLKYNLIRSDNADLDLYYLCNCDNVILSRSTYALSSLFFNNSSKLKVFVPYFNVATSLGLTTNFDRSNINYYN